MMHLRHMESEKVSITVPNDGFYKILLHASASTAWEEEGNESLMVRVSINQEHHQDIIIFYGQELFTYSRLLGKMIGGEYEVELQCYSPRNSLANVNIEKVSIERMLLTENEQLATRYAPKLFGRSVYSDYDNLYTDIPLEMIYFFEEWQKGKVIEYHMVFSHEDEGTPAQLLMTKWGRLLDIEYMARVYLNEEDMIDHVEYQGAHHVIKEYMPSLDAGQQIILQTATCNGNFTEEITSSYCFAFIPSYEWKKQEEAREAVMERFPYVNQVMRWESERQLKQGTDPLNVIEDIRDYIFIQSSVWNVELGQPSVALACKLEGGETWYYSLAESIDSSIISNFTSSAYTGPYNHYGTAILLPSGKKFKDIEAFKIKYIADNFGEVSVKNLKVLAFNEVNNVEVCINEVFVAKVSQLEQEKVIWHRQK